MGVKASTAVRARQRELAARVERLIAHADNRAPIGSGRRAAILDAVRDGRAALRKRDRAMADLEVATTEVGAALNRIVDAGLKHFEAFEALGLSVGVGRRLLYDAKRAADLPTETSSTAPTTQLVDPTRAPKAETNATGSGGSTKGND